MRKYVFLNYLPSAKTSKLPSHQVLGVFALEVNKILQATPLELGREMGMCATALYVQQQQWHCTIPVSYTHLTLPTKRIV